MRNLLAAEWYKLRKNGTFRIICLFMLIMVVFYPLVTYWSYPDKTGSAIGLTGIRLFVNSLVMNQFFLKLLLGLLAGFFIAGEYSAGVLKRSAATGHGRGRIYMSKLAVYTLGIVLASLILPVLSAAVGGLMSGLGLLSGFGRPEGLSVAAYLLRTVGFTVLFAAAFAAIAAFIAVALADSGKTIGVGILFFLFVDQVLMALSGHFAFLAKLYDYSLFKLFAVTIEYRIGGANLLLAILMPIAAFAVFALLGARIFSRQELR